MWTVDNVDDLRRQRRQIEGTIAFVPTMGALHEGHVSLITAGRRLADNVLVSIYVNPTQFNQKSDLEAYPRPLKEDLTLCKQAKADGVFCPSDEEIYPPRQFACDINVPDLASTLEGEHRPGHFSGVCRVVAKLFNLVRPNIACFGRKDYQQLKVIEAMVNDLAMQVHIIGCPTVRELEGMAMSSRNKRLSDEGKRHGLGLYKALSEARAMIEHRDETDPKAVEAAMRTIMMTNKVEVDYAVVRHPQTLRPIECIEPSLTGGVVALVAGKVDGVRLIDNMVLAER